MKKKPAGLALALLFASAQAQHAERFTPKPVTHAGLTVVLRDPGDQSHLARVFQVWQEAGHDLQTRGLTLPATRLTAARSAADFAHLTGYPANIAAITVKGEIYTQRLAAVRGRMLLPYTLRHEAFHLAQPPGLPRWLAEGLARIFSGEAVSGEAGAAPASATGLEGLSSAELSRQLSDASGEKLTALYREATRRAARELARRGWAGALKVRE